MNGNVFEKKDVILIQTLGIYAELINRAIPTANLQTSDFFNNNKLSAEEQKKKDKAYLSLENFLNECSDESLNMFVAVMYIGMLEKDTNINASNRHQLYKNYYNDHLRDVKFHSQLLLGKYRRLKDCLDSGLKLLNPYLEASKIIHRKNSFDINSLLDGDVSLDAVEDDLPF